MCFHSLFAMFEKNLGFQPVDQGSSYRIRHNVDVSVLIWWFISIYWAIFFGTWVHIHFNTVCQLMWLIEAGKWSIWMVKSYLYKRCFLSDREVDIKRFTQLDVPCVTSVDQCCDQHWFHLPPLWRCELKTSANEPGTKTQSSKHCSTVPTVIPVMELVAPLRKRALLTSCDWNM